MKRPADSDAGEEEQEEAESTEHTRACHPSKKVKTDDVPAITQTGRPDSKSETVDSLACWTAAMSRLSQAASSIGAALHAHRSVLDLGPFSAAPQASVAPDRAPLSLDVPSPVAEFGFRFSSPTETDTTSVMSSIPSSPMDHAAVDGGLDVDVPEDPAPVDGGVDVDVPEDPAPSSADQSVRPGPAGSVAQLLSEIPYTIWEMICDELFHDGARTTLSSLMCFKITRPAAAERLGKVLILGKDTLPRLLRDYPSIPEKHMQVLSLATENYNQFYRKSLAQNSVSKGLYYPWMPATLPEERVLLSSADCARSRFSPAKSGPTEVKTYKVLEVYDLPRVGEAFNLLVMSQGGFGPRIFDGLRRLRIRPGVYEEIADYMDRSLGLSHPFAGLMKSWYAWEDICIDTTQTLNRDDFVERRLHSATDIMPSSDMGAYRVALEREWEEWHRRREIGLWNTPCLASRSFTWHGSDLVFSALSAPRTQIFLPSSSTLQVIAIPGLTQQVLSALHSIFDEYDHVLQNLERVEVVLPPDLQEDESTDEALAAYHIIAIESIEQARQKGYSWAGTPVPAELADKLRFTTRANAEPCVCCGYK